MIMLLRSFWVGFVLVMGMRVCCLVGNGLHREMYRRMDGNGQRATGTDRLVLVFGMDSGALALSFFFLDRFTESYVGG